MCVYDLVTNDCIHCQTEEEAIELFRILSDMGIVEWRGGNRTYCEHTRFENDIGYGIYYFLRMDKEDNIVRLTFAFRKEDVHHVNRILEFQDLLQRHGENIIPQTEDEFMKMMF